jgi:hypothetical protein
VKIENGRADHREQNESSEAITAGGLNPKTGVFVAVRDLEIACFKGVAGNSNPGLLRLESGTTGGCWDALRAKFVQPRIATFKLTKTSQNNPTL